MLGALSLTVNYLGHPLGCRLWAPLMSFCRSLSDSDRRQRSLRNIESTELCGCLDQTQSLLVISLSLPHSNHEDSMPVSSSFPSRANSDSSPETSAPFDPTLQMRKLDLRKVSVLPNVKN